MALSHSPRIITDGLVLCLDAGNYKSHLRYSSGWSGTYGSATNSFDGSTSTASGVVGGTFSATYTFPTPLITSSSTVRIFTDLGASSGQIGSTINIILINGVDITQKLKNAGAYGGSAQWIDITTEVGGVFKTIQLNGTGGVSNPGIYAVEVGGQVLVDSVTWTDLSGQGNNGALVNGVGYDSGNLGSLVFDGVNDYSTIPHSSSLNFPTALTISVWYYSGNAQHYLYLKGRTDGDNYNPLVYANGRYGWTGPNGRSFYNPPTGYIQANTWYNLTVTHISGNDPIVYKNSIPSTSHVYTEGSGVRALGTNTNPVGINADVPRGVIGTFNGKIASIQAYNRALAASEVQQNFNALRGRFGI